MREYRTNDIEIGHNEEKENKIGARSAYTYIRS